MATVFQFSEYLLISPRISFVEYRKIKIFISMSLFPPLRGLHIRKGSANRNGIKRKE